MLIAMQLATRVTLPLALLSLAGCAVTAAATTRTSPAVSFAAAGPPSLPRACPPEMARVDGYCVDKWEAYVVEIDAAGRERPHSPYELLHGAHVRAKSAPSVIPQGYLSQIEARSACREAGKRLCSQNEFTRACRGPDKSNFYPYGGQKHERGICNEGKFSGVTVMFGRNAQKWTYANFNDPRLNHLDGGLAPTGSFEGCVSPEGAYDMVGNLHEWVEASPDRHHHVRFRGGSYGDAELNGPGCLYVTSAHEAEYHDYTTGFRCCKDANEE
jgi:sulfatase modifying factor 1